MQAAKEWRDLPNGAYLSAEIHWAELDADKKPVVGSDGFFVADRLFFYAAMARDAGWGKDIPDLLSNDEWNCSVFTLGKQYRPGVNQADELGFDRREFVFAWVRLVSSVLTACT